MAIVARTLQTEADLIQIWLYIAGDNPEAADALLDRIDQQFELLAANPSMGRPRPKIAPEASSWTVGNYLILYRSRTVLSKCLGNARSDSASCLYGTELAGNAGHHSSVFSLHVGLSPMATATPRAVSLSPCLLVVFPSRSAPKGSSESQV